MPEYIDQFQESKFRITHTRTLSQSRLTTCWLAQYRLAVRAKNDGLSVREDGRDGKAAYKRYW